MDQLDLLHHTYGNYNEVVLRRLSLLPPGGKMKDLPEDLWHKSYLRTGEKKTGGPNLRLLRLRPNFPSHTITAYIFNKFVHPVCDRYLTPREAARIQGFPDSFLFAGGSTSAQKQIGNAVPVALAEAVANHVKQYMGKYDIKGQLNAVSLFSGAGGMDIGFEKHFNLISAVEIDKDSCQTLRKNFGKLKVIEEDITKVSFADLAQDSEIDLIFGGPPCQSFSAAGKQKGLLDPRGTMIGEFMRMVEEGQPKMFVLENVPGMLGIQRGGVVSTVKQKFHELGYLTEHFVLTAADYGAPQMRRRLFFIGRKFFMTDSLDPPPITHSAAPTLFEVKPYVSVMDAIGDLPPAKTRDTKVISKGDKPSYAHKKGEHSTLPQVVLSS